MSKGKVKSEIIKDCSRHSCSEKGKFKKCKYCKQYFCKKHIEAFAPYVGINESADKRSGHDGHPCPSYVDYLSKEEKRKKEQYQKDLDRLLGSKKRNTYTYNDNSSYSSKDVYVGEELTIDDEPIRKKPQKKSKRRRKNKRKVSYSKYLFPIFILILIALALYFFYPNLDKGDYESEKILDENTIEVLNFINEYREKHNVDNLTYSENMYEFMKTATENKDIDSQKYKDYFDFKKDLENNFNLENIKFSYYESYSILGGGFEKFKSEFNKNIGARNLIKDKKYSQISFYCALDNCLLYIFDGSVSIKQSLNSPISQDFDLKKKLESGEVDIPPFFKDNSCGEIENHASNQDISSSKFKKNFCGAICGDVNLEYNKYKCDSNEVFHCYCKERANE